MRKELDILRKIGTIALAALLAGGTNIAYSSAAKNDEVSEVDSNLEEAKEIETSDYVKFSGIIKDIEKEEEKWTLTVEDENGEPIILFVDAHSFLFHNGNGLKLNYSELEKGTSVEAYYDKNKPMILIYPARVTPDFMIINEEKNLAQVKVGKFDEKLLSLDGQLKLNIDKETILVNQLGESIEQEDLNRKELIVFYNFTTRSIPPQTSPSKIIAFDKTIEKKAKVAEIIKNDHLFKEGVKMIPLRAVAEELGYYVQRDSKIPTFYISKQNLTYTITRGKKVYGYNRSIGQFEVAPFFHNDKTYVPEEFLELLLENE